MARAKASLTVDGLDDLLGTLSELEFKSARRALERSTNFASTPIVREARKAAPEESGLLKMSMGKKQYRHKKGAGVSIIIGPRTRVSGIHEGKRRIPANYAHLVEFGHLDQYGFLVPPQPFLRPAMESTRTEVERRMRSRLSRNIIKEAQRAAKRK